MAVTKLILDLQIGRFGVKGGLKGLSTLRREVKRVRNQTRDELRRSMDFVAADLLERSAGVAPILTGDLIRSGRVVRSQTSGEGVTRLVTYGTDHALFAHEAITPSGPFQLGPISRKKPSTSDGVVGGGFLVRPFNNQKERYGRFIVKSASRVIEKF